jgi:hypothetical protein
LEEMVNFGADGGDAVRGLRHLREQAEAGNAGGGAAEAAGGGGEEADRDAAAIQIVTDILAKYGEVGLGGQLAAFYACRRSLGGG